MYHRGRKKMRHMIITAVLLLSYPTYSLHKTITSHDPDAGQLTDDHLDNTIIDFEEDYTTKFNKKHGIPWNSDNYFNKESHRYTLIKDYDKNFYTKGKNKTQIVDQETTTVDYSVIPLELISTTESELSVIDSTVEYDLTVIPIATTEKSGKIEINQTVVLPTSTEGEETTTEIETTTYDIENITQSETTVNILVTATAVTKDKLKENVTLFSVTDKYTHKTEQDVTTTDESTTDSVAEQIQTTFKPFLNSSKVEVNKTVKAFNLKDNEDINSTKIFLSKDVKANKSSIVISRHKNINRTISMHNFEEEINSTTPTPEDVHTINVPPQNTTKENNRSDNSSTEESEVPIFTELDTEDQVEVPEDYYDTKDVVPTTAPKTDALSVIFGLAGSVVESVAERVVPKSIFDLFKRMQRQNEALEAERLRSREENGGLGQFGRGILKSISTGIGKPLSQLMAGVRDIGSLDSDRGFVTSLASGVTSVANVANSVVDAFKDRVQAIYPGTVWCGDGRSAAARSSDLGLFFFTDTCCRQHDACKLYIRAGETKYGLTNTGLFTRSHCSCDAKFRACLGRTNSLVSAQIGLTYFNVLGPQCFRRAHPIIRCVRRTRITGQKCEEYELDYSKPRMWQWFDNETF